MTVKAFNGSLRHLKSAYEFFPYPSFKRGQDELLRFLLENPKVLVEAPTGFGKTVTAICAILPFLLKENLRLLVFTRTKNQIFNAWFSELYNLTKDQKDFFLKAVPLIGKNDLCIQRQTRQKGTTPRCSSACPYYVKTKSLPVEDIEGILECIAVSQQHLTLDFIKDELSTSGCPYFILRAACKKADVIVTTHAWLTNPTLRELLLATLIDGRLDRYVVLIDEVHNFSYNVTNEISFDKLYEAKNRLPFPVIDTLLTRGREAGIVNLPEVLHYDDLEAIVNKLWTDQRREKDPGKKIEIQLKLNLFSPILEFIEDKADFCVSVPSSSHRERSLIKINPFPGDIFRSLQDASRIIGMSATLRPIETYQMFFEVLDYRTITFKPYEERRVISILRDRRFSSQYRKRTEKHFLLVAKAINSLHVINPHHTIVFTPSHTYKKALSSHLQTEYVETRGLKNRQWLQELPLRNHELILGVAGGRFSEGIEILDAMTKQSLLTLIIFAGLPFPPPTFLDMNILLPLYTQKWGKTKAQQILSDLPMVRTVLQGAGRGVRGPDDYTAIVFLDHRVLRFPDLRFPRFGQLEKIKGRLYGFYNRHRNALPVKQLNFS